MIMGFQGESLDIEKGKSHEHIEADIDIGHVIEDRETPGEAVVLGDSAFAKIQHIASKLGVEQRGIERVPDEEKTDTSVSHAGTLWLSANMIAGNFAVGVLAVPVFGLGFVDSALVIVFMNILGILPVCFFSTFGPRFGLRQIVLSRFYFGYHGVRLIAAINIVASIGWSAVSAIVGAQLINAINPAIPGWAGIVVIAASTLLICVVGYRLVHIYERFAWIPCFVIFLVVLGLFARSGDFVGGNAAGAVAASGGGSGAKAGAILSFSASIFGTATGWCALAADYTVYLPASTPRAPVFLWTFAGLFFSLVFTELLGAAVATAMTAAGETAASNPYRAAYDRAGIGGLLAWVLIPALGRFGEFCIVVLALSLIACNCPNTYSASLSLQALLATPDTKPAAKSASLSSSSSPVGSVSNTAATTATTMITTTAPAPAPASTARGTGVTGKATKTTTTTTTMPKKIARGLQRAPRAVWAAAATAAYVAVAVPGYAQFEAALESFMLVTGYWLAVYEGVALTEHVVFRWSPRRSASPSMGDDDRGGYRPEDYADPQRLPPGRAAFAAFLCGVAGAALGMAQPWYVGPVGRLCGGGGSGDGGGGGDVGFELAFAFTVVSYLGFRMLEKRRYGR